MKNQNFRYYERCNHFPSYLMKNYDSPKKSPYYGAPPDYYWCDYCSKNAQQYPKDETPKCLHLPNAL